MAKQVLKVNRDTIFKRRPEYAGHLPDQEKYNVSAGTEFEIQSYAYADSMGDFDEHIKFALKDKNLNGFNTWYVYNRHAEVEFDGEVVYPLEEQTALQILRVTRETVLKRRPVQSSELSGEEMHRIPKDTTFALHSYAYADARGSFNDHIKFAIDSPNDYINGLSTWYVYEGHAQIEFDGEVVYPIPAAPAPTAAPAAAPAAAGAPQSFKGKAIALPGGKGTVYTDQPIIPGGAFTWGEATHGGTRIPQTVEHANNMVALAKQLQKAREQIGKPFRITSWYRPEPWNSRAGGARRSQHLHGGAIDIVVEGYNGRQLGRALMSWWPGGMGIYPGNRQHILHLDIGAKRNWGF